MSGTKQTSSNSMETRPGTTDLGKPYEQQIQALLAIKCVFNSDVKDMKMASNLDGLGAFDDLVLFTEKKSGEKNIFLVQIKFRENKPINNNLLTSNNKNFGLGKYETSFREIKNKYENGDLPFLHDWCEFHNIVFIILTNAKLNNDKGDEIFLNQQTNLDTFLNTGRIFKVNNRKSGKYDDNFLGQFYLYCGQIYVTQIEVKIKTEIEKHFKDMDIAKKVTNYFSDWSLKLFKDKIELTNTDIESKLLEELLMKYIFLPSQFDKFSKAQVWNEVTDQFNFVSITNKDYLKNIWYAVQSQLNEYMGGEMVNLKNWNDLLQNPSIIINKVKQLSKQDLCIRQTKNTYIVKDIFMLLWSASKLPLIVNLDMDSHSRENVRSAISRFDPEYNRRYIFFGSRSLDPPKGKSFANLECVAGDRLSKALQNINVSLQSRKSISLDKLSPNGNTLKEITPDVFLNLLEYNYVNNYSGKDPYIPRFLQKPLFSVDVLLLSKENATFVLVGDFKHSIGNLNIRKYNRCTKWNKYKTMSRLSSDYRECFSTDIIVIDKLTMQYKVIIEVIKEMRQNEKETVHFFQISEEPHLEWLYSNQNINTIKPYRIRNVDPTFVIPDESLFSYLQFHILSDTSGEGKTMLLEYLKDNCPPDMWMVHLNIKDISDYIQIGNFYKIKEFLYNKSNTFTKDVDMFRQLFQNLLKQLKVLIVIDGLDDITFDSCTETFLNEIKNLGVPTLVTTRPSLKDLLEDKFNTLSLQFKPLNEDDKKMLIQKYETNLSEDKINLVIHKTSTLGNKLIAVPLQIKLFGAILKNANDVDFTNFDIWDLYEKYINTQLERVNVSNRSTIRTLSRLGLLQFYQMRPVEELFDIGEFYDDVEDKMKDLLESKIIQTIEKNDTTFSVTFCHKSVAEFLTAKFFYDLLPKREVLRPLLKNLFCKELEIVRLFFDKIILKSSPLHKAVLENNEEIFRRLMRDEKRNNEDQLGRSVLHIAAAYGKYIELRTVQTVSTDIKILTTYNENKNGLIIPCCENDENYRKVQIKIEFFKDLLKYNFDPYKTDKLFNMDAFDFAIQSNSLEVLEVLCTEYSLKNLANKSVDKEVLLYHCVKEGYWNIFRQIENKNFKLKNGITGENLLHVGLPAENFEIINEIIDNIHDINEADCMGNTALVSWLSSLKLTNKQFNENQKNIFQLLIDKKTEVNSTNLLGYTALHLLSMSENICLMKTLIQNGADINIKSKFGDIPLHCASQCSLENVQLLVEKKSALDVANVLGRTPIGIAAKHNKLEILRYLISKGSTVNNHEGGMALIEAVLRGNAECARLLIDKGANVKQQFEVVVNETKKNVLWAAIGGANLKCVELVYKAVAPISKNMCFELLHLAAMYGHSEVFDYLIYQGVDLYVERNDKITLLHYAVSSIDIDCVKFLLSKDFDVNVKDKYGFTPLHLAAGTNSVDILKLLISKGANINAEDNNKKTPLTIAYAKNHFDCVLVLIMNGAQFTGEMVFHKVIRRLKEFNSILRNESCK